MNKLFKTILIFSIAFLSAGFLFTSPASANGNLVVQFEKGNDQPLFNEASFLPGDTVTRWVRVTNNTTETQQIGTQAITVSDPDDLGDVLEIVISENGTDIYGGSTGIKHLSDFFNTGEIYLSDLAGNETTTTYNYSITFDLNAGDEYQGLGLGFDFYIGFLGESVGQEMPPGVGGNGGGGGGGASSGGLIIFNEAIGGVGSDTVTITWDTNLNATSRVIYSPSSSNPVFNINTPPNYGYTNSTTEDSTKVTGHSVTITGLTPATVYFFRCVSHNSPDTLSPEYSFTTLSPGQAPIVEETPLHPEQGEVLGEAIIRTALPETGSPRSEAGGIFDKIAKSTGLSSSQSNEIKINLLIGAGLIFIWIVLFLIRWGIKRQGG